MSRGYTATDLTKDAKVKGTLPGVIKDALFNDIAMLILSAQIRGKIVNQNAICARFGVSRHVLKNYIRHPDFIKVYEEAKREHYAELKDKITDSKADPIVREIGLWSEATSLAGEAVEALRQRIRDKKANSKDYKTAIDAFSALYDRSPRGQSKAQGGVQVNINTFNPSIEQATAMRDAESEAGIDISDVLDVRDRGDGVYEVEDASAG